jgi:histidyl-tRNA synthetase
MQITKPSIPRGTRDFGPDIMAKRNFILDHIKKVFKKYGFLQIETPCMENLQVLTGKYGDEGDQLIYKILNSGNFSENLSQQDWEDGYKKLTAKIAEKALRYDLTVPFARFVAMNRNDITFPFKRFQIQPVWRADRPQKGRYREFFQCDADVVGTHALLCEAEIILMIKEVFENLGISAYCIKINNRKILQGIAEAIGKPGQESVLCVAIDKLDKIGIEGVCNELKEKGYSSSELLLIEPLLKQQGDYPSKIEFLNSFLQNSAIGKEGIAEIEKVWQLTESLSPNFAKLELDLSLARGLSYYTGAIFEVKALNVQMGSISGGGRYDNLTGVFGLPNVPGVGISFGIDRIYDIMEELGLFPNQYLHSSQILVTFMDEKGFNYGLQLAQMLRNAQINTELYPEPSKIKKQFEYAHKKNIPLVAIIGEEEMAENKISVKNMRSGKQIRCTITELISQIDAYENM